MLRPFPFAAPLNGSVSWLSAPPNSELAELHLEISVILFIALRAIFGCLVYIECLISALWALLDIVAIFQDVPLTAVTALDAFMVNHGLDPIVTHLTYPPKQCGQLPPSSG
jgi:hypothetical protein